jgi:hypothetical protein
LVLLAMLTSDDGWTTAPSGLRDRVGDELTGGPPMMFQALADLTVLMHFAFILFVLFGGFLVRYRPWLVWLHVPTLLWALGIEAVGWRCPLTVLEKWLRASGGSGGYLGGFVRHWIISPLFDPGGIPPAVRSAFALVPVALSAIAYWQLFRERPRRFGDAAATRHADGSS